MANMYRYRIIRSDCFFIPDTFIDLVDGKYFALIFHQKQQNIIFDWCQAHILTVHSHFFQIIVDGKSAGLKYFTGLGCIA